MRALLAVMLVVVGGLLIVPANVAIWARRQIGNEDRFVQNVDNVFNEEDVQILLAQRMTDRIVDVTDLETRIESTLAQVSPPSEQRPSGDLTVLQGPITRAAEDAIYQASLRVIQSDRLNQVLESALRVTHRSVKAVLNRDNTFISQQGNAIVLDLTPALEQVIEDLGGERGQQLVDSIDIPEDAGQFVLIEKSDQSGAWNVVNNLKYVNPWVPIAAVACFALAIVVARDRRGILVWIGATIAIVAAISLLLLALPLRSLLTGWPPTSQGQAAARSIYDVLLGSYQGQNILLVLFGGLLVGAVSLTGDRRYASPAAWARKHKLALRLAGLAGAGLALLAWPNLSTRWTVEVLVLLVIYLLAVEVVTSDAAWAGRLRSRLGSALAPRYPPEAEGRVRKRTFSDWVAARRMLLRVLGVVVGVVIILVWPSLTPRLFFTVIALELLYLAAVEIVAERASKGE